MENGKAFLGIFQFERFQVAPAVIQFHNNVKLVFSKHCWTVIFWLFFVVVNVPQMQQMFRVLSNDAPHFLQTNERVSAASLICFQIVKFPVEHEIVSLSAQLSIAKFCDLEFPSWIDRFLCSKSSDSLCNNDFRQNLVKLFLWFAIHQLVAFDWNNFYHSFSQVIVVKEDLAIQTLSYFLAISKIAVNRYFSLNQFMNAVLEFHFWIFLSQYSSVFHIRILLAKTKRNSRLRICNIEWKIIRLITFL